MAVFQSQEEGMAGAHRARVWKVKNDFDGEPKISYYTLVEEEVSSTLKAGGR